MARRVAVGFMVLFLGLPLGGSGQTGDSLGAGTIRDLTRIEFVQPNLGAKLDRLLEGYEKSGFSGCVIIGWGGLVALHKGYGFADRERGIKNGADTAFPIGRLTMQFTAGAILQLIDQEKIGLNRPIGEILGPFPGAKSEATVKHLLTHTAGLVADEEAVVSGDREAFLDAVRGAPADFRPGTSHHVSRIGYNLLAMIIEEVSGTTYETYVREQIFESTGMISARFLTDPPVEGHPIALGYEGGRSALGIVEKLPLPRHGVKLLGPHLRSRARRLSPSSPPADDWSLRGCEGIVATVGDLFQWEMALRGYRLLSDASKETLFAPTEFPEAYGWRLEKTGRGTNRFRMGSEGNGYATEYLRYERFLRYVYKDLVVILAINNDMGWSKPVWKSIEDRTYGEDYSTPFAILAILVILLVIGGATRSGRTKPRHPRRRGGPPPFGGTGHPRHTHPVRRRYR